MPSQQPSAVTVIIINNVKNFYKPMAKVVLAPFISSISGKVGDLEFRTLKSGRTVVRARRQNDYVSTRALTDKEKAQRRRFSIVSSVVASIQHDYDRIDKAALDRKKIWQKVSYLYAKMYEDIKDDKLLKKQLLESYKK